MKCFGKWFSKGFGKELHSLRDELPTTASSCQSSSGETREEVIESSRTRIIRTSLAQEEPMQINDLEDMPVYDEYADSDWYDIEAALNLPFQAIQARVSLPPKPPHHCSRAPHVITTDPTERGGSTTGTPREEGQDESDFDHNKARTGRKPKEKQEEVPQTPNGSTLGVDFCGHPSSKFLHLGRGVRNSVEPD